MTISEARELLGWTQGQLDREAGLPKGTTHDLESGRNRDPRHKTVVRITRALQRGGLKGITEEALFPVTDDVAVSA